MRTNAGYFQKRTLDMENFRTSERRHVTKTEKRFSPIREHDTKKETAVKAISRAIFSGRIRPGERLNESKLARQFQISRAPIREALQQLQEQGLIISVPRRGMFVVSLQPEDIQKINSLRLILEAEALRLARAHLTPETAEKLEKMVERMEHMGGEPTNDQVGADLEFHRSIWALSGNEYLERTLNGLVGPLFAHAMLEVLKNEEEHCVLLSHRPLLDFIRGRSSEAGEGVMLTHLSVRWKALATYSSLALEMVANSDSA
jgi:DNA-binding GntR family transcriptional regulator